MALKGDLKDMSLSSLISINCNEMNRARLTIRHQGREAALFFADGNIAHVVLDSQEGEEAIYELLTWEEGEFELERGVGPPKRTVTTGWSGLLLEGMRRIDESAAGLEVDWDEVEMSETDQTAERIVRALKRVPGIDGALICSRQGEVLGEETAGDPAKEAALTAFVGRRSEELGFLLCAGQWERLILSGQARKAMVVPCRESNYLGLVLGRRAPVEALIETVRTTLRRYE